MAENKTKPSDRDVVEFLNTVEHDGRREDAIQLLNIMTKASGFAPRVWGDQMVGFGSYDYTYNSGHSGTWFRTGFAPRKANMVVYIMPGFKPFEHHLKTLGKHKHSKSCLYLGRLKNIDLKVLEQLVHDSVQWMNAKYPFK